jgi:hypothetical protein
MKCIFIIYGMGVKGYHLWDHVVGYFLYSGNVIFREVKPSPIVVQPEGDEKNSMVYISPKIEKNEPKNEQEVHDGPNEEEDSNSLKEEEETPPQTLRSSTR